MEAPATRKHDSPLDRELNDINCLYESKSTSMPRHGHAISQQSQENRHNARDLKKFSTPCPPIPKSMNPDHASHYKGCTGDTTEEPILPKLPDTQINVEEKIEPLGNLLSRVGISLSEHMKNHLPELNLPMDVETLNTENQGPGNRHDILADFPRHLYDAPITPPETPTQGLLMLDINSILSTPSGSLSSSEKLCPMKVQAILSDAEKLLSSIQVAYVQSTFALREMTKSRDCLAEKLEQSETRAESLRSQLENQARENAVDRQRIAEFESELKENKSVLSSSRRFSLSCTPSQESKDIISVFASHKKIKTSPLLRHSYNTQSRIQLDTIHDTDETTNIVCTNPESQPVANIRRSSLSNCSVAEQNPDSSLQGSLSKSNPKRHSSFHQQSSDYSTLSSSNSFFGFFTRRQHNKESDISPAPGNQCVKCSGKDVGNAWDTVNLLKEENHGLKNRVFELEAAIDDALDAVTKI